MVNGSIRNIGKIVKLRFAGYLFARLGIENVGVASYAMMSKIKLYG